MTGRPTRGGGGGGGGGGAQSARALGGGGGARLGRGRPRSSAGERLDSLVGAVIELEVGAVAHGGSCVARLDGQVVFVRHALPGERVRARITSGGVGDRFLRADAVEVVVASAHRVVPPCRFAEAGALPRCGGCDFQHVERAFQLELKTRVVAEQLARLAGINWDSRVEALPDPPGTAVPGTRWRTRTEFAVDEVGRLAMRAHRSHDVVAIDDCLIADRRIVEAGVLDRIWNPHTGHVDVVAVGDGAIEVSAGQPAPPITERVLAHRGTGDFRVAATGFWQVHPAAAATLVDAVLDGLEPQPGESVLDLYSGVGLFTRYLALAVGPTGRVLGVEGDQVAAGHAQENLADLPWAGARCSEVRTFLDDPAVWPSVDLVVLDPPRSGARSEVMAAVLARRPRRVAYVACDPAALARDLGTARSAGWRVEWIRAYDAFPMTHHVECVALLTHSASDARIHP